MVVFVIPCILVFVMQVFQKMIECFAHPLRQGLQRSSRTQRHHGKFCKELSWWSSWMFDCLIGVKICGGSMMLIVFVSCCCIVQIFLWTCMAPSSGGTNFSQWLWLTQCGVAEKVFFCSRSYWTRQGPYISVHLRKHMYIVCFAKA